MRREIKELGADSHAICEGTKDCGCPNCGGVEFKREFHMDEMSTEVFCVKCGFVVFG
tara:strand:+ start:172 stop:342 length:171 start_codon:yes stop_codon:yes gene_type:complete